MTILALFAARAQINHTPAPSPSITLTTTLPTTMTVGTAVNATVTATLNNGATGPVTLTATGLPAGVTIGSTTGSGPYTAPITGTPTTAGNASVVLSGTGGSVSVTPLDVSVTVNAAGSGPAFVQSAVASAGQYATLTPTLAKAATAGDVLVGAVAYNTKSTIALPSGWTSLGVTPANNYKNAVIAFYKIAAGGETSFSIPQTNNQNIAGAIAEFSGAKIGTVSSGTNTFTPTTSVTLGPTNAPASPSAIPCLLFNPGAIISPTPTLPAPWTAQFSTSLQLIGMAYQPAPDAAVSVAVSGDYQYSNSYEWLNVWIEPA